MSRKAHDPIEIYVPDWDDEESVRYALQVVTMLERHGYPVGQLFVADQRP